MKRAKLNAIFLDVNNDEQVSWFFKKSRKLFPFVKMINYTYLEEHGGYIVKLGGMLAGYFIKKNNCKFLMEDAVTAMIKIAKKDS